MAAALNYKTALSMLPHHMRHPMLDYIERGYPPGGFLTAVLTNNLREAVARADGINEHYLPEYIRYLLWYAPSLCWGDKRAVETWIDGGGLGKKDEA